MCEEIRAAWQRIKADPAVNAVVLRAAGDRAFCAGLDVKKAYGQPDDVWNHEDPGELPQPEVAEGLEAGRVRGAGHLHRGRVLLRERGRHRDLLERRDVLRLARHLRAWCRRSSRSASCAGSGSARRCASRCPATTSGSRAETALRIGLVTEVVDRDRAVGAGRTRSPPASRRKPTAATQGTVRAIWESLDRPYRAAMEQGLIYTRLGNPIGMAEVEPSTPPARDRAEDPLMRRRADRARRAHRRGARHRSRGAGASSSRGAGTRWGELARDRRRRSPRSSTGAGRARSACCCATGPRRSGCCSACCAPAAASSRSTRSAAPSASATTSPPSTSPSSPASRTTSRTLVGAGRSARRRSPLDDLGAAPSTSTRPAPAPTRRDARPGVAVQMLTSGTTGPPKRIDLTYETLERVLRRGQALRVEPRRRAPAARRRRDRQLAARAPRRAVPRPAVRQRRPVVRAARAVHGRRLGRRRPPPPPGDGEPRARGAAHGARGRPRPRRPRAASARSCRAPRRSSPDDADAFTAKYGMPVLISYAATEFGGGVAGWNLADHRAVLGRQARQRRPGPPRLRAARRRRRRRARRSAPTRRGCSR